MKDTRICDNCGAEHPISKMFEVEGDWLCEDCVDRLIVTCDRCGDRIYQESAIEDDHHTLCEGCFDEHYVRCHDCGCILRSYDAYFDDDDHSYCSDCWDEHEGAIHDYNYTPDLVFHGKGLRHFGVELEIDEGGTVNSNAQKLLDIANANAENLYIKTDGSLDEGLELVTHPLTLEYHLNEMPWEQVLRKAQRMGYLSHAAGTCGLHVHISRLAFGCTYEQQEAAIARLLYFVEKFWAELLRFSRRTQSQMNRWAARYGIRLTPSEQMSHAKNSCAGRYTAVNLTNSDTVEIRMFRGTLKLNTLKATLQMVNHLVEVAVSLSDYQVQDTVAVIVLMAGAFLKKRISFLQKFCIPAPVIGGLLFAILTLVLYMTGVAVIDFDDTLKEVCMVFFFTSVGFQANLKVLKSGGKSLIVFLFLVIMLIVMQNFSAIGLANLIGLDSLTGMTTGSIPMVGGHGTPLEKCSFCAFVQPPNS